MHASSHDSWLVPATWRAPLRKVCSTTKYEALQRFVDSERESTEVLPAADQMFSALKLCDFESVRVVILGQDPYPTPGHAHGLAFSVLPGVKPPGSLKNIFTELRDDVGVPISPHGHLDAWAQQGVLLLNAVLTVRAGQAASHAGEGCARLPTTFRERDL